MFSTPRIGHGYDLHRLEPVPPEGGGRPFVLGGVKRAELEFGPLGHSAGDALFHAVTDALLGAIGSPDIGQLFPDTDPRHDNEDSRVYVLEAVRRVAEARLVLANLDATIIAQRPKIAPMKEQMVLNLTELLDVEPAAINIKGKTHEGVDAVGEGRALEVHVIALLLPA